jgi:hypothetical protein
VTEDTDSAWRPQLDHHLGRAFKWGLNGQNGALEVWEVHGPGDGFPSHQDRLQDLWGRSPTHPEDRLGVVHVNQHQVELAAYFSKAVPEAAVSWARRTFPNHVIRA